MKTKPLNSKLQKYLIKHNLENKFKRQIKFLQENPRHPSLNTEVLEPKYLRIYSFRIDRKYRAIFIVREGQIEIIDINDHYR